MPRIEISYETADEITLANLKQSLKSLKDMLKTLTHPEDIVNYQEYINATKVLIKYYGG